MTFTIHQVAAEFDQWRKRSKRGRVPNALKEKTVELYQQYSTNEITELLKIKPTVLERWLQDPVLQPAGFVSITSPLDINTTEVFEPKVTESIGMTLLLPNGIKLLLGKTSTSQCVELVTSLLQEIRA